jgi:microcystin degradation protein MlrC
VRAVFAAFGTETNAFSTIPTRLEDFDRDASRIREHRQEILVPFEARAIYATGNFYAFAPPAGATQGPAYLALRDELLDEIRRALPVDFVLLLLHGAMVAEGIDDCEGNLLERVRTLVGAEVLIGATLDPHAHLTPKMVDASDLLLAYKEYPHIDAQACSCELARRLLQIHDSGTRPGSAVFDCRMISLYHTNREPMQHLVEQVRSLEDRDGISSVSIIHGFPWGDVPEMGTKVLVYGSSMDRASRTAESIGRELIGLRGKTFEPPTPLDDAIAIAKARNGRVVLADASDNPGGGAPGDGTWLLHALFEAKLNDVALGAIWDPQAVAACEGAGIGARIRIELGGKSGMLSGEPFLAEGTITALKRDFHTEVTGGHDADTGYGTVAVLRIGDEFDIVLATQRSQIFAREFFERLGIRLDQKRTIAVKSTNHFYHDFSPIADRVIYVDAPGALRQDFSKIPYRNVRRPLWPLDREAPGSLWPL